MTAKLILFPFDKTKAGRVEKLLNDHRALCAGDAAISAMIRQALTLEWPYLVPGGGTKEDDT